jgi:hypothetical protein
MQGRTVYNEIIKLFQITKDIMDDILKIILILSQEISFAVGKEIKNDLGENEISYKRTIITKPIKEGFERIIETIKDELQKSINKLEQRNENLRLTDRSYALSWLIEDIEINGIVENLLFFLDIDATTLKSKREKGFWHLLYRILDHNIEKFDNTYIDPSPQFQGTSLAEKIEQYHVFEEDKYNGTDGSKNFDAFISYIKGIEDRCAEKPSEYDLLDLVFTLLQQMGVIYHYKGIGFGSALKGFANVWKGKRLSNLDFSASNFEKRLFQLAEMVENYQKIFAKRDFGGIVDTKHIVSDEDKKDGVMQRGSIPYLLLESHSTSRRILLPKIKKFLQKVGAKK